MTKEISLKDFKEFYEFHKDTSYGEAKGLLEDLALHGFIAVKKPVLTKEMLKEQGISGKTVLKHRCTSNTFLYLGFNRADTLVTDDARGECSLHWEDYSLSSLEIMEESND